MDMKDICKLCNAERDKDRDELLEMLKRLTRIASVELGKTRPEVIEQANAIINKPRK